MGGKEEKLIPSVEVEKSISEGTNVNGIKSVDKIPLSNDSEEQNFENGGNIIIENKEIEFSPVADAPILNNVNGKMMPYADALIDTLDIYNTLNMKEILSNSDVVFDVTNSKVFRKLPPETDLNVPPANWLHPSVNLPNPIKIKRKSTTSNSFYIANMFPEYNNQVDIVADADIIKQIFKIPYNPEQVSVMVRKIGNVLLIDNFDERNISYNDAITKENTLNEDEMFAKLKTFCNRPLKPHNSNKKLRQRNLFSKFLYRSVVDDPLVLSNGVSHSLPNHSEKIGRMDRFSRVISWSFEKTKMLIGTNMLKATWFENGTSRNVSLHVSNAGKPIKISNAIDMWLDNLMCDIPEAVICYQSGGMVKDYEYIQTQNIPHLLGSQFSVSKIKNSAQMMFSFLCNQKYEAGQIYWLLKYKNDNLIKFYNLNMINTQVKMMKTQLIHECGKLWYGLGHHQYYSSRNRDNSSNTHLLDVSIANLHTKIHPEIIASADYLIVDLAVSYKIFTTSLFSLSKDEFANCKNVPESMKKICLGALDDITEGLECLQYFRVPENTERKKVKKNFKSNDPKVNFKHKIDKKQAKDEFFYVNVSWLFPKKEQGVSKALPTWRNINEDRVYWKNHLKFLFYQKAELVYGILAQHYFYYDMFGLCLRSLSMMMRFNKVKTAIDPSSHSIPIHLVLVMAGDCCKLVSDINVSENTIARRSDCRKVAEIEKILKMDEQHYKIDSNLCDLQVNLMEHTKTGLVKKAIMFYQESLNYEEMDFVWKKLSASNLALGSTYLDMLYMSKYESNNNNMHYFEQSKKYMNEAIAAADSSLERVPAIFYRAALYYLSSTMILEKAKTSCEDENNLLLYFRLFLDSVKDVLQILYDEDSEDCRQEWNTNFNKLFSSVNNILGFFSQSESKIVAKLYNKMFEGSMPILKKILKICELQNKRYNYDINSYYACGMINWCIATVLNKWMKMRTKSYYAIIRNHFKKATKYFSLTNNWDFYMLALDDRSNFLWYQTTDEFDITLKGKMKNVREGLKTFYELGIKLQEINFQDEDVLNTVQKFLPHFEYVIENLLFRGIELIETDWAIAKKQFDELNAFNISLCQFQDNKQSMDFKIHLKALIVVLHNIGISMEFSKETM